MNPYSFDITKEILISDAGSLRNLAELSGFSASTFYSGADLTNLDLSGSNLTGLNFQNADLRGSNLSGTTFDKGSFNGAKLDLEFEYLKDEFEFSFADMTSKSIRMFYVFGRFRSETLEYAIRSTGKTYWEFAKEAGINIQTLRRARRKQTVSFKSIFSIAKVVIQQQSRDNGLPLLNIQTSIANQPLIEMLGLDTAGNFTPVDREEFGQLLEVAEALNKSYNIEFGNGDSPHVYRFAPNSLRWYLRHGHYLLPPYDHVE